MESVSVEEWVDREEKEVDLFTQLARLHALIVYQIIRLFNGEIHTRHVAEGHMAVQDTWAHKHPHLASRTLSDSRSVATQLIRFPLRSSNNSQQQWSMWLLSESIRRTWLVAVSFFPTFSALQQGWSVCPGSVMYTNCSGLWDAASATEWDKRCLGRDVAFLQHFECAKLFDNAQPADVNEFGIAMLEMTFDKELPERWRTSIKLCRNQYFHKATRLPCTVLDSSWLLFVVTLIWKSIPISSSGLWLLIHCRISHFTTTRTT